jgi:hypothetical protein
VTQRTSISDQVKKITATGHLRLEPCAKHCVSFLFSQAVDNDKEKRTNLELEGVLTCAPWSVVRPCTTRGTGWADVRACSAARHGQGPGVHPAAAGMTRPQATALPSCPATMQSTVVE